MISRARRILFAFLVIAVVTMSAILIRLRERAQDRLHIVHDSAPLIESAESAPQSVTLVIPDDLDGSLQTVQRSQSLPPDDSTKARVLLETLIEAFHDPHSTHPIAANAETQANAAESVSDASARIDDVFLMPVPRGAAATNSGTLAVVDLSAAFAASHPSGIEPETLTLLSILGTLHANIPAITQVHFLIDGHPAETLAGHADLTRTYLTTDIATGIPQS
jgi:Sporulation and spore germination